MTSGVTVVGGACAPARPGRITPIPPDAGLPRLTWLSEFTRPAGTTYPLLGDSRAFGSLSGLARDDASGQWLAVVDDRAGSRLAWLSVSSPAGRLEVSPTRLTYLRAGPGVADRIATEADLEAIVALPDGTFLMSEEGHITKDGIWPPALLQVTRDGVVTGVIDFPPEFQFASDGLSGVRDNQGFESLTRMPNGRIITGLEQPLADRPVTSTTRGGDGRLVEFEPHDGSWVAGRQWRYAISPTPAVSGFPVLCGDGENGLVELLALTDTTLIAMERACRMNAAGTAAANAIQLFAVTLSGDEARKTLLLDLSTLAPRLSPALSQLDNFEGLAFGPLVAGARTLLVMSDDNFRATQNTSFLLFGLW